MGEIPQQQQQPHIETTWSKKGLIGYVCVSEGRVHKDANIVRTCVYMSETENSISFSPLLIPVCP